MHHSRRQMDMECCSMAPKWGGGRIPHLCKNRHPAQQETS